MQEKKNAEMIIIIIYKQIIFFLLIFSIEKINQKDIQFIFVIPYMCNPIQYYLAAHVQNNDFRFALQFFIFSYFSIFAFLHFCIFPSRFPSLAISFSSVIYECKRRTSSPTLNIFLFPTFLKWPIKEYFIMGLKATFRVSPVN